MSKQVLHKPFSKRASVVVAAVVMTLGGVNVHANDGFFTDGVTSDADRAAAAQPRAVRLA